MRHDLRETLCHSFVVDPASPSHLKPSDKIFNLDLDADVYLTPDNFMEMTTEYSDSNNTASKKVATEMGVEGHYGAFSGSASMSVSQSSDSSIKTVRLDAKCLSNIALVSAIGDFNTFPEEKLTESFKKAAIKLSPEKFSTKVGVFYAADAHLGGRINKSYTMQATKEDTEVSVKAELEAQYGKGCWGVTGTASNSVTKRTSNEKSSMKTEWRAQGGDTAIWLNMTFSDSESDAKKVGRKWADSVCSENAYPIKMTLRPIWELVKEVDEKKGAELETYLTNKWSKDAGFFNPKIFLDAEAKISTHDKAKKMLARIEAHKDWLINEKSRAQSWIDTWYAGTDITRNRNWRDACNQGISVMDEVAKEIKGEMTLEAFKAWLHDRWRECDARSKHHWGMNGHDSVESNRIQEHNRDCVNDIKKMC